MRLVKIERDGRNAEGLLDGDTVHLVGGWRDGPAEDAPFSLSKRSPADLAALPAGGEAVPLASVTLAVPIDPPAKIICVGMNYRDHLSEIKVEESSSPTIFLRTPDSLVGHDAPIVRPRASVTFDFEGEIAVVIGRAGRHIAVEDAMDHVGGYSCFMDGSVREYQKHSVTAGKNFWHSGAMGPWIVPASEWDVADASLATRLNGETVQSARASQMIFGIRECISYCSRWLALRPGDVIATGTPGGVGSRRTPPLWMKAGDRLEVEVEGVGVLSNPVVDEG
ncbi:fumarylacetoacetate hydrolase family protein [Sphingomonas bacterium]|uniref:fumarylacetoacetate hydrolase family protein n=1 Tax=Sphingomonas bacterium TaxID=1895847 RepID=UPI001575F11C|nr:fumarylacetoacetate hydrolase family protein [Sphingomonas bacterium]